MVELKIFSATSNKSLADKIGDALKVEISPLEITIFSDGEKRVRVVDRVVEKNCVVIVSTAAPVNENYMELFLIVDALKRSGAKSVTAVIPYLGYQRQDHVFRDGEAVSLEVIARIVEGLKVDKIITFDLHSIKIPEVFNIPVVHLSALPLFTEKLETRKSRVENTVLVSPDMGGIRRIKILSEMLGDMPYATVDKNRDLETGEVTAVSIDGEVLKRAIIVDDMISSGKTAVAAADILAKNGAEEIIVMATHAIFSGDAAKVLQNCRVSKVVVTDSIEIPEEKRFDKLEIIGIADLISQELKK